MEPARTIVERLGGAVAVAAVTGVHRTRVYGWMRSTDKGGTGGTIPFKHVRPLLDFAETQGIALTANDFLPSSNAPAVARVSAGAEPDAPAGARVEKAPAPIEHAPSQAPLGPDASGQGNHACDPEGGARTRSGKSQEARGPIPEEAA